MTDYIARVSVNGIEVGTLPPGMYNNIDQEVRRNKWLYLAQLFDFIKACFRFVLSAIQAASIAIIFLGLLLALLSPASVADIWGSLMHASPLQVAKGFQTLALFIFVFATFAAIISMCFTSYRFGAVNVFQREIDFRIREILEVPVDGDLNVRFLPVESCVDA